MTKTTWIAAAALAAAGTLASGAAMARGDVQWAVTIAGPVSATIASGPVRIAAPVWSASVVVAPAVYPAYPVAVGGPVPVYHPRYHHPSRWDVDGDGIPNRHDRVYNPRWDRDGDGIPNRRDPRPGRSGR